MAIVSDQIGDFLTRIRNATMVRHAQCKAPFSKIKMEILRLLKEAGYIRNFKKIAVPKSPRIEIVINLKYKNKRSVIQHIQRFSKPGLKHYVKKDEIPQVQNGLGTLIISTSKGLMTGISAREQKLGGELLVSVW